MFVIIDIKTDQILQKFDYKNKDSIMWTVGQCYCSDEYPCHMRYPNNEEMMVFNTKTEANKVKREIVKLSEDVKSSEFVIVPVIPTYITIESDIPSELKE